MTVGQLRQFLRNFHEDNEVVISGPEHCLYRASVRKDTVLMDIDSEEMYEHHGGKASKDEDEITVCIIY